MIIIDTTITPLLLWSFHQCYMHSILQHLGFIQSWHYHFPIQLPQKMINIHWNDTHFNINTIRVAFAQSVTKHTLWKISAVLYHKKKSKENTGRCMCIYIYIHDLLFITIYVLYQHDWSYWYLCDSDHVPFSHFHSENFLPVCVLKTNELRSPL